MCLNLLCYIGNISARTIYTVKNGKYYIYFLKQTNLTSHLRSKIYLLETKTLKLPLLSVNNFQIHCIFSKSKKNNTDLYHLIFINNCLEIVTNDIETLENFTALNLVTWCGGSPVLGRVSDNRCLNTSTETYLHERQHRKFQNLRAVCGLVCMIS